MRLTIKLSILILLLVGFTNENDKHGKRFEGGRLMYSSIRIDLNDDSTYYLSEWMHPTYFRRDTGTWTYRNKKLILNSISKTCLIPCRDPNAISYRFENQKCELTDSTLQLLPKRRKDKDFYTEYFRLYLRGEY